MSFFDIVYLLGGLALFLYGMTMLGSGLEHLSGGRLESLLEKLSNNVFKAVLLGALVTAAVQSSSATTVIVVGLVNARILKLRPAIGVIMGANIGTTITAHILRLTALQSDNFVMQLLNPSTLAPLVAIVGIILFMSAKRSFKKNLGQILLGFGILFTGMFNMSDAVAPLKDMPQFAELFSAFSNPVLGVLVGAVVTAIIQSSSASIGILQALSATGAITFSSAIPIILGQNIGTCVTPILASIGASKNAKRSAIVHLSFNIIGTIIFLAAVYLIEGIFHFPFWNDVITTGDIANFHTLFNVTITILFLPFTGLLEKIVCTLIKDNKEDSLATDEDITLDDRLMVSPGLAIDYAHKAVERMGRLAGENFGNCMALLRKYDLKKVENILEIEATIDRYESKLGIYMLKLAERELSEEDSRAISELLNVMSEFERVGDYSVNIKQSADYLFEKNLSFSDKALQELDVLRESINEIIGNTTESFHQNSRDLAFNVEPLEQVVDRMISTLNNRHIERLKQGECSIETGFRYVDILSCIERIADHCSNVGVHIVTHAERETAIDRHDYLKAMHQGASEQYSMLYDTYLNKYYQRIQAIQ